MRIKEQAFSLQVSTLAFIRLFLTRAFFLWDVPVPPIKFK